MGLQYVLSIFGRTLSDRPLSSAWRMTSNPEVEARGSQGRRVRLPGNLILMGAESGNVVTGVFTPVLAKHSKSFSLIDCISVGVDRMQRNFEPMRRQVEAWQRSELTDVAFRDGVLNFRITDSPT
jgi:hypothetical protein